MLITVPGKYLGTNGTGPCIGGPSSEASVWKDSLMDAESLCDSLYARSRRLARRRRRQIENARARARSERRPTEPPTAPANVATLFDFECEDVVGVDLGRTTGAYMKEVEDEGRVVDGRRVECEAV